MSHLFKLIACACIVVSSFARAQVMTPMPAAELKQLDYFVGTWKLEGEFKPGILGPAEKVTGTDRYEWMDGGFFLAGHSDFNSAEGAGSSLAVMGYNPLDGVYTYDSFNSMGDSEHAKGSLSADTWIWTAHAKIGAKNTQSRYLVKMLSPISYSFQYVMSEDGFSWVTLIEGKASKVK